MWDVVLVVCLVDGDEVRSGGPGLALVVDALSSSTEKLLSFVSTTKDSNKLVEKLGIPQLQQCHEILFNDM